MVATTTSEDSEPTVWGLKYAWKLKVLPCAILRGRDGTPIMLKLAFPVSVMFVMVTPILAVQVTVLAAVAFFRFANPKSYGEEQLMGKLTGDPKP